MSEKDLAFAIIKSAMDDIEDGRSSFLNDAKRFFNSEMFDIYCVLGNIGASTKSLVKKNIDNRCSIMAELLNLCEDTSNRMRFSKSFLYIDGCPKRALYNLERSGNILLYLNSPRLIKNKPVLKIRFTEDRDG